MRASKRDYWRKHVRGWVASGQTCKAYAGRARVNHHTLSWWKARLQSEGESFEKKDAPRAASFVEVLPALAGAVPSERIAIDLHGMTIRISDGFSPETLRDVLRAIETRR